MLKSLSYSIFLMHAYRNDATAMCDDFYHRDPKGSIWLSGALVQVNPVCNHR
jgi:hypothetical protein